MSDPIYDVEPAAGSFEITLPDVLPDGEDGEENQYFDLILIVGIILLALGAAAFGLRKGD